MQLDLPLEMPDLRKSPYMEAPADPLPYVRKSPPRMVTAELPIGTQAAFIAAADTAAALGAPLNRFLTIRWRSLFSDGDVNALRVLPIVERIDYIIELLRKWLVRNSLPPFYIWVRENADDAGEHQIAQPGHARLLGSDGRIAQRGLDLGADLGRDFRQIAHMLGQFAGVARYVAET